MLLLVYKVRMLAYISLVPLLTIENYLQTLINKLLGSL